MSMSYAEILMAILGLMVVNILTRSLFVISEREWVMPSWLQRGLRYAPLAALAAVVAPEVLMTHGEFVFNLRDARLYATAAATAYFFWRRGILGTIVSGMAVLIPLKLVLGW